MLYIELACLNYNPPEFIGSSGLEHPGSLWAGIGSKFTGPLRSRCISCGRSFTDQKGIIRRVEGKQ